MVGNQKYCPSCGTPNPAEVVFCVACGTKFPVMNYQAPAGNPPVPGAPVTGMPFMPQPARSDFITLACPNCGGRLQITPDIERFTCQFCGYEHLVRRSGGMVSLEPVVQAMNMMGVGVSKIGTSSEKQAAEQSIARLKQEIQAINYKLSETPPRGMNLGWFFFGLLISGCSYFFFSAAIENGSAIWILGVIVAIGGIIVVTFSSTKGKPNPVHAELMKTLAEKQADLERNYEIERRS